MTAGLKEARGCTWRRAQLGEGLEARSPACPRSASAWTAASCEWRVGQANPVGRSGLSPRQGTALAGLSGDLQAWPSIGGTAGAAPAGGEKRLGPGTAPLLGRAVLGAGLENPQDSVAGLLSGKEGLRGR